MSTIKNFLDYTGLTELISSIGSAISSIWTAVNGKLDTLTFDNTPTANSNNPVKSGGIKTALDSKQSTLVSGSTIKTINGTSLLGSGNITTNEIDTITVAETTASGGSNVVTITDTNGNATTFNVTNGRDGVSIGEVGIVDDIDTGGHTDVLSAEMGKVIGNVVFSTKTYTESDLTKGKVWANHSVTTVSDTMSTNANFGCIDVPVVKGDIVTVHSKSSAWHNTTWAITDTSRNILSNADRVDTAISITLSIEQDGHVFINCASDYYENFAVYKKYSKTTDIIDEAISSSHYASEYKNNSLPLYKDTLKVLAIGNSYTEDPTSYLKELISGANIDTSKLCVYIVTQSSSSLLSWVENYEDTSITKTMTRVAGALTMGTETQNQTLGNYEISGSVQALLSKDWDVVVVQQVSSLAGDITSFDPYLMKMIGYIRKSCTNPRVAVAYQSVWSYKSGRVVGNVNYGDNDVRWKEICHTTRQMTAKYGIDILIPTGTAILNARGTTLNTDGELTRDGTHLTFGVGRYIAACTWFLTLIAPMFGVGIVGNPAVHALTSSEENASYETYPYQRIAVDSTNKRLCQLCAFFATIDRWKVTAVTNETIADYNPTYPATILDRVTALEEETRKVTAEDLAGTSDWIKAMLTSAGWLLEKYIKSDGTAVNGTDYCVTPYIQIGDLSNHILEIRFGFANGNCCIALYTSSGSKVAYYGATSNPRTVTLGSVSTATQLRVTFNINDIPNCYIYDKTADEYIIKGNDVITDILKNNLVDYKLFKDTLVVQNSGNSDRTVMSQKAVGEAIEDAPLRKMKFNNYAVFGAYTNKTCTSVDTYNIDELKVITSLRVVDTFGANSPSYYNYGLGHILGIVRASSPTTDYLSLYGDGYNLYLWFKKNGTDVLKYSLGASNGRKILRTFARIDLYGKTVSLYSKAGDGTYLTLVENYDISGLDLSNLQKVKIVTSVGTSHNDKMLFNHVQVNNYIIDPKAQLDTVVNYGEYSTKSSHKIATKSPTPSTLMFTNEGSQTGITTTLNEPLHKIITVDRDTAGLVYNFGFYSFGHSPSHMQTYAYEIYKVKFTNVTSNLLTKGWSENSMGSSYILNPETYTYTKIPMNSTTGTVLEYEIEEGKTYFFIYVIGSGYHTHYNHYLGGHFTMEITEPTTYCVGSMNLCGEYYDGQYFCGHIPFKSGENFIPSVYGQFNDTYNLPAMKGRMRLSGANVQIYNGSAWKQINNS